MEKMNIVIVKGFCIYLELSINKIEYIFLLNDSVAH